MEKFIEITFRGEVIGLVNIDQIVNIVEVEDVGVAFTLTVGNPIHTDMPYADIKKLLGITK